MARSEFDRRAGRLVGQEELFETAGEVARETCRGEPVECLGLTFENEDERRAHYLDKLREGLDELWAKLGGAAYTDAEDAVARMAAIRHWPMGGELRLRDLAERMRDSDPTKDLLQRWKDQVGFPHGGIEDILDLSDPPWHTACPNPFLGAFVEAFGKPYNAEEPYQRKPFAVDVSEGKNHAVYRAHGYHTKVPHLAIIPFLLHYTNPGDLVLDGFSGSGMSGVAAQWCETAPKKNRETLEAQWNKEGFGTPNWGLRRTIQCDISPLAGFITANYTLPFDIDAFAEAGRSLLEDVDAEIGWMYETMHADGETKGCIDYTVWSEVFGCQDCGGQIVFVNEALNRKTKIMNSEISCPHCRSIQRKEDMDLMFESFQDPANGEIRRRPRRNPVFISYDVNGEKFVKNPSSLDVEILNRVSSLRLPSGFPTVQFPACQMTRVGRMATTETTAIHHMFLPRPAQALAVMWRRATAHSDIRIRHMLLYFVEQAIWGMSVLNRYGPNHYSQVNRQLSGVYYIPSQISEVSPSYNLKNRLSRLVNTFSGIRARYGSSCIVTASTTSLAAIPDNTVDYVFTDPPFGENIYYADLNFLIESWHGVLTNVDNEAIVDRVRNKSLSDYRYLIQGCFAEYYRVLKPGRWITIVFHNSKNAVWTAIQEAMQTAGFVVADVRTLDKQQKSFQQTNSMNAVKQDLVISAYKPDHDMEENFLLTKGTEEGVWDFIRTHLAQLPVYVNKDGRTEFVNERQPHVLFDRMVAFHVLRRVTVPLSVSEFLAGLVQRYPERDGMVFLLEQVAEYDKKRSKAGKAEQFEIFVVDESSAIQWLRRRLTLKPQSFQDIHPHFLQEITGWQKHERLPELYEMLDQNFLRYDGIAEVPSQIHRYLSTNFKEFRNLSKDNPSLRAKAKDRWYVPDPNKIADVEMRRTRALLREFDEYRQSSQKRLSRFRLEAVRAGFLRAYQNQDYATIIAVANKIPESVLQEDQKLILWYDQAVTRMETA